MGRILGVFCLAGLRFFLGELFFCEEHLDILLSFHQFRKRSIFIRIIINSTL